MIKSIMHWLRQRPAKQPPQRRLHEADLTRLRNLLAKQLRTIK